MSESGVKISDLVAQLKNEANQDREQHRGCAQTLVQL